MMNRSNWTRWSTLALWLAAGALAAGSALGAEAPRRPNIVVILADDMGFSDLGCYGSEIATPNIDALARNGLRFTQFYNTARCCPTRASLLTGLYPHQAGVGHMVQDRGRPAYRGDLSPRCVTIAEALRPAGYHTLMVGKWHVTPVSSSKHNWPLQRGFERYYGIIHGAASYFDPVTLIRDNEPIKADSADYYFTDALAENAVRLLDEYAAKPEPFFFYVAFTAPHWPLHARPEDIAKYEDRYKKGWDALRAERHKRMIELGIVDAKWPLTPRDPVAPAWENAEHKAWQARRMAVYAAQIDRLDRAVGTIVRKLRDTGRLDDTLILFLADNGGCAEELGKDSKALHIPETTRDGRPVRSGNDPAILPGPADTYQSYGLPWANASNTPFRRYKHWVHEGGISTPLIAHWPKGLKAEPGSLTHQPGHLIDIMATCLDLAGAEYPKEREGQPVTPLEGKSLRPILEGQERAGHEAIYWEHEGNRAVRQGKWKLVSRYPGPWELYDMEADRTELNDLAAQRPEIVAKLSALYERWAERSGVVPWSELNPDAGKSKKGGR
ncbi:MAG: arylsulfatase [Isosphaeraceae bacterium]|nr:arylsulfatase [Isosphaeraceae bacterium]